MNENRLAFFPRDRSKPDGRWHSCRACNRIYWATRGKPLEAQRKADAQAGRQTRQGLRGLRQYGHPGDRLGALPPELRSQAERLLKKYLTRHGWHMTGPRYAALVACAASNAKRVGDRSWARGMRRLKGYRRAQRRAAE